MFEQARELINNSKSIYIVGHVDPDGDSIGSAFSLCLALRKIGKEAFVLINRYSDTFKFLPGINKHQNTIDKDNYDLLIGVDCSDKTRLDISDADYNKANKVLMLDHHIESNPYGDVRCINSNIPAVCELVFDFIEYLGIEIDKEIATYIYSGIITDSGSFNYSSTKPSTLRIAAKLMETGIDFSKICKNLNNTIKEEKLYLISKAVQNMEVYFDGKLRITYVSHEEFQDLNISEEDVEGMSNYLKMVKGTEVAVYIYQKRDLSLKVSLRSNFKIDVSQIAIKFGGGGHARAAGYTMLDSFEIGKKKLIDFVEVMLK